MTIDPQVHAYLDELRRALADQPADERELVVDGVRQHIDDAVGAGVPVQQVLDDLGDPVAIAAEAGAPQASADARFLERRSGGIVTALLVGFGGFVVPVLGWVAGLVLLWLSHGWRTVDKVLGTAAPFIGLGLALVVAALLGRTLSAPVHLALLAGPVLGAIAAAVYLLLRFRPAQ